MIDIISFDKQSFWDFYQQTMSGYFESEQTSNLGTLTLMKTREGIKKNSAEFCGLAALTGIGWRS